MTRRESAPLAERLTRMESDIASLKQDFEDFREWQHERAKVDDAFRLEMRRAFNGEGAEPGIMTRLDRLEQSESRRTRHYWIVFGTALAALCTTLANLFGKGGP